MDPTDWSNITESDRLEDNVTEPTAFVQVASNKKRRGRPRKSESAKTSGTSTPNPEPVDFMPPPTPIAAPPSMEEMMSAQQLIDAVSEARREPSPRRTKFEPLPVDEDEQLEEDVDTEILTKIYESFFKPPLSDRHAVRKRNFPPGTPKKTIEAECKKLQRAVGSSDPAADFGRIWAGAIGGMEPFALMMGYPVFGLGQAAQEKSTSPQYVDTFRELLIKYPRLRSYMALGGFPELKLLVLTGLMTKEVLEHNILKMNAAREQLEKGGRRPEQQPNNVAP